MNTQYENGIPIKRGRGRPKKQVDPRYVASCANCGRTDCETWPIVDRRPAGIACVRHFFKNA